MSVPVEEARSLVDTNVVVYADDLDNPPKHVIAVNLLEQLSDQGRLVFSSQVFHEFCSVMTASTIVEKSSRGNMGFFLQFTSK